MSDENEERTAPGVGVKRYARLHPGFEECYECLGDGACFYCDATGFHGGALCPNCHGTRRCILCRGAGQIPGDE